MARNVIVTALGLVVLGSDARAVSLAVITSPPTLLNVVILGLACAAVVVGVQLLGIVKGGALSRPWQILVAGFGVLALCQISILLQTFEIVALPSWISPTLAVIWAGAFFYGVFETRKVLA